MKDITVNTKLAAIIGTDIGHSKSPAMMNAAFQKLGLDAYYYAMNIKEEDLHLQTEETDGYMFASKEQIEAFAKEGIFLHYDSIKQVFK